MYKNIILAILGLGVVAGVGLLALNKNNVVVLEPVNNYTETPPVLEEPIKPNKDGVNNPAKFGQKITLRVRGSVTYPDSLHVMLKEINDSRCPKDVQCIWAGEISGTLSVSDGKLSKTTEVHLGMMTTPKVVVDAYTFTLKEATTTSITFTVEYKAPVASCYIGGCSGQICSDQKDVVSTCEYREEYACYKKTTCERQKTGKCGWTPTAELQACLSQY